MIELSSEARRAYEVMVSNLEQSGLTDVEQEVTIEGELQVSSLSEEADTCSEHKQPEEAEYSKSLTPSCNFGYFYSRHFNFTRFSPSILTKKLP